MIRWLGSDDFSKIVTLAGLDAPNWRERIGDLFRVSEGLKLHYANRLITELGELGE